MRKGIKIILVLLLFICRAEGLYAYGDHRKRNIDSLETILAADTVHGAELGKIYRSLANGYQLIDVKKSSYYANKLIKLSEELNLWGGRATAYRIMAVNQYYGLQYDSSMFYYEKALWATDKMSAFPDKYTVSQIDDTRSSIYGNMGNLMQMQGKLHEAVSYYLKGLAIFEKHGYKEQISIARHNIGLMYMALGNYDQALSNMDTALVYAVRSGDSLRIASAYHGLADIYISRHDYGKALEAATKAGSYFFTHTREEPLECAGLNNQLAIIYMNQEKNEEAEVYVHRALRGLDTIKYESARSTSYLIMAELSAKKGRWREAEQAALKSLEINNSDPLANISRYQTLAQAYAHLGDAAEVEKYSRLAWDTQKNLSAKNYQSALAELEVKYETEKKELQIASLKELSRRRQWLEMAGGGILLLIMTAIMLAWLWARQKRKHAELQVHKMKQEQQLIATRSVLSGEIQERTRISRDLHDGLGGILSAARLNIKDIDMGKLMEQSDVERFIKAIDLIDQSILEMRRVAHHLMPESLSRFGLKAAVGDFCNSLPGVKFIYYGNESRLDSKFETMIYRSIHELVNNAVKHAGATAIMVQIVMEKERVSFIVQDDGCGFDPKTATKGMGLENIRTRVASFGGNISIDSSPGEGTEVSIEIRLENNQI